MLNEPQGALTHLKQCLHYDPEQKECKKLFRHIKKITKELASIQSDIQSKRWATANNHLIGTANRKGILQDIESDFQSLETTLDLTNLKLPKPVHGTCYQLACELYGKQEKYKEIEKWCSLALECNPEEGEAYLYRGQAYLHFQSYEDAVGDLEKAHRLLGDTRVRTLLHQAHQKLKQSKKMDYYKLLDVSPNADTGEIKKAYRKQAHAWHPDKYNGELDKEQVEKRMAEINQAYAVLSDADMRQQYDNGYDPESKDSSFPSQQEFHFQNGFPFGGNGYSFRF